MPIVVLQLPDVKQKTENRPSKCPYCKGETFQRWGKGRKPIRDSQYRSIQVYRFRCCQCQRTFRHYPLGVDRADQTQRMRKLAAICWMMGLSLRGVKIILEAFSIQLSHMTVWRDMNEAAEAIRKQRHWKQVRVLGLDGVYPQGWGKKQSVLIAVDLGSGQPMAIGHVDESNPQAVRRFLEPLVQRLGVSVIVTDDLASFRIVAEKLGLEHQICQFHVRRWVGRALHELRETVPKEWHWVLDEVSNLIHELPPEGGGRLFELWKQVHERSTIKQGTLSPLGQLRNLLIRLSEHWSSYRLFTWQKDVPWTNNGCEQAIGRMKVRSRTVRGYKSWQGMSNALILTASGVNF